ncbi:hypothetical protein CCACVL1_26209 [Corchorus capsularis]|uniref:Uncharacterized protein n=1 Tax=Corchorus capsularis TaxID=210143 RepID=A0A1R3GFK7_COCAP|nr:hypothetical protein CCACVL1_26209 [Corchorus capsularis]
MDVHIKAQASSTVAAQSISQKQERRKELNGILVDKPSGPKNGAHKSTWNGDVIGPEEW